SVSPPFPYTTLFRSRGRLPHTAALHPVELLDHLLPARARGAAAPAHQPLAVPVRLATAGAHDRRTRTGRGRLDLPGGDRRARARAPHEARERPHGGHDHRSDGPLLLGP